MMQIPCRRIGIAWWEMPLIILRSYLHLAADVENTRRIFAIDQEKMDTPFIFAELKAIAATLAKGKVDSNRTSAIGLIILLHRRGHHHLLSNKRVLSLLNTLYKIFTKAFQLRLTPILMQLIYHSQNAFPIEEIHTSHSLVH